MARPKKDEDMRRTAHLPRTRCTPSERGAIEARAAQAGMSLSDYMRQMALHGHVIVREPLADKDFIFELKAQGRNFNQYQKKLNALHLHVPEEVKRITTKIEKLIDRFL